MPLTLDQLYLVQCPPALPKKGELVAGVPAQPCLSTVNAAHAIASTTLSFCTNSIPGCSGSTSDKDCLVVIPLRSLLGSVIRPNQIAGHAGEYIIMRRKLDLKQIAGATMLLTRSAAARAKEDLPKGERGTLTFFTSDDPLERLFETFFANVSAPVFKSIPGQQFLWRVGSEEMLVDEIHRIAGIDPTLLLPTPQLFATALLEDIARSVLPSISHAPLVCTGTIRLGLRKGAKGAIASFLGIHDDEATLLLGELPLSEDARLAAESRCAGILRAVPPIENRPLCTPALAEVCAGLRMPPTIITLREFFSGAPEERYFEWMNLLLTQPRTLVDPGSELALLTQEIAGRYFVPTRPESASSREVSGSHLVVPARSEPVPAKVSALPLTFEQMYLVHTSPILPRNGILVAAATPFGRRMTHEDMRDAWPVVRSTIHFTLNHIVAAHAEHGGIAQRDFLIVIPLRSVLGSLFRPNQIAGCVLDYFVMRRTIDLTKIEGATLIINQRAKAQVKAELPSSQRGALKVLAYDCDLPTAFNDYCASRSIPKLRPCRAGGGMSIDWIAGDDQRISLPRIHALSQIDPSLFVLAHSKTSIAALTDIACRYWRFRLISGSHAHLPASILAQSKRVNVLHMWSRPEVGQEWSEFFGVSFSVATNPAEPELAMRHFLEKIRAYGATHRTQELPLCLAAHSKRMGLFATECPGYAFVKPTVTLADFFSGQEHERGYFDFMDLFFREPEHIVEAERPAALLAREIIGEYFDPGTRLARPAAAAEDEAAAGKGALTTVSRPDLPSGVYTLGQARHIMSVRLAHEGLSAHVGQITVHRVQNAQYPDGHFFTAQSQHLQQTFSNNCGPFCIEMAVQALGGTSIPEYMAPTIHRWLIEGTPMVREIGATPFTAEEEPIAHDSERSINAINTLSTLTSNARLGAALARVYYVPTKDNLKNLFLTVSYKIVGLPIYLVQTADKAYASYQQHGLLSAAYTTTQEFVTTWAPYALTFAANPYVAMTGAAAVAANQIYALYQDLSHLAQEAQDEVASWKAWINLYANLNYQTNGLFHTQHVHAQARLWIAKMELEVRTNKDIAPEVQERFWQPTFNALKAAAVELHEPDFVQLEQAARLMRNVDDYDACLSNAEETMCYVCVAGECEIYRNTQ